MHQLEVAGALETAGKLHLRGFLGSFLLKYSNEALTSFVVRDPHSLASPTAQEEFREADVSGGEVKYEQVGPCSQRSHRQARMLSQQVTPFAMDAFLILSTYKSSSHSG